MSTLIAAKLVPTVVDRVGHLLDSVLVCNDVDTAYGRYEQLVGEEGKTERQNPSGPQAVNLAIKCPGEIVCLLGKSGGSSVPYRRWLGKQLNKLELREHAAECLGLR